MRVLMLCHFPLNRSGVTGGTSSASLGLVEALLASHPIEVTTFTVFSNGEPEVDERRVDGRLRIVHWTRRVRYASSLGLLPDRMALRAVMRDFDPDLVHAQSVGVYAQLALSSGRPSVVTVHGMRLRELDLERSRLGEVRYRVYGRQVRKIYRNAQNLVYTNRYTRREVDHRHKGRTWEIPNAVDESFFRLFPKDCPEVGRLLLVGGLRERKDVLTALRTLSELRGRGLGARLDVVGPTDSGYARAVEQKVEELALSEAVTVHGLVSEDQIRALYCASDILLLPSLEETAPICIMEGMAAGKPIVATRVGGVDEMVREGETGFLHDVGDATGIATSIARLMEDRELRSRFSRRAHQVSRHAWSSRAVADATMTMYHEILERSASPSGALAARRSSSP